LWHTAWFDPNTLTPLPHTFQVDLRQPHVLTGFRYLPRQDSIVARIAAYRIFVSNDANDWGQPILTSAFPNSEQEQVVRFEAAVGRGTEGP
jgi:hypothetical protein